MSNTEFDRLKDRLLGHLKQVVRDRSPGYSSAGHFFVSHYIQQELSEWGEVEPFHFTAQGKQHTNWILNLSGQFPGKPPILIGAHYDTVPGCPGADDNGTGIAALLEIARAIKTSSARHPVRLIAFDLEEYGLTGSRAYAQHLYDRRESLRLMLSLEMLGYCDHSSNSQHYPSKALEKIYPHRGNFIALIGQWQTIPAMTRLCGGFRNGGVRSQWLPVINQGRIVTDTRRSDHAPFWDLGYPAIMVTDTANLRNPHYHQPTDALETLDLDFLTKVCQGLIRGIQSL
jgi:Zn-dependent M28 family amino/carboxypeptidase